MTVEQISTIKNKIIEWASAGRMSVADAADELLALDRMVRESNHVEALIENMSENTKSE